LNHTAKLWIFCVVIVFLQSPCERKIRPSSPSKEKLDEEVKHLPNIITSFRFLGAIGLLFFEVKASAFWVIFFVCGVSDILDGYLARKLHFESKMGALLDSLADLAFVIGCCFKLIPVLAFPKWLWIWGGAIVVIKVINQISALVMYRKCIFPHTIANKMTGVLLFAGVPLTFFLGSIIPVLVIAVFATFAAVQEGHFIRTKKTTP
jgi:CDP-diacylglycerol--glycerol-3-phosphate 3-phosphatidyltransferase